MKKEFSTSWKASKKPAKQRKYRYAAPLHVKKNFMHSHLAKDLRAKYKKRAAPLRKGDKVKIMIGSFKKQEGKVERIDLKKTRVYIAGMEKTKKDGSKKLVPFNPSNLMIVELILDDKKRQEVLERKK